MNDKLDKQISATEDRILGTETEISAPNFRKTVPMFAQACCLLSAKTPLLQLYTALLFH